MDRERGAGLLAVFFVLLLSAALMIAGRNSRVITGVHTQFIPSPTETPSE